MSYLGIDFGTTNSAVSVYLDSEKKVVTSDYEGTLIYFDGPGSYYFGNEAITQFLADGMQGRFIRSIKSVLHASTFQSTYIFGKRYYAEDLVALILIHLKEIGSKITGEPITKVVLGRPARFSPEPAKEQLAQKRLLKAAQIAGFDEVVLQLEPIAAAYAYEAEIKGKDETVLIGDFGGGTADFTIMKLGADRNLVQDRTGDILGSNGIRVGGDDFDAAIAWNKIVQHLGVDLTYDANGKGKILRIPPHHYRSFCRWENHFMLNAPATVREIESYLNLIKGSPEITAFLQIIQENLGFALFDSIEKAKINLTDNDQADIIFHQSGIEIEETITIAELQEFLTPSLQKIKEAVENLMQSVGLSPNEIDSVFLTGGTSLVRPVREIFTQLFGEAKIREKDAFQSVAEGLALYGRQLEVHAH